MKTYRLHLLLTLLAVCALTLSAPATVYAQKRPRSDAPPPETRKIVPVPRDQINVDIWFDKQCGASYAESEKIMINFQTTADGYVTIYDIDTRGQVTVLFPNRNDPDNFVRGNQTYMIPNRSYKDDFIVTGPEGIEYVDIVASSDPYYHWNYNRGSKPGWVQDWGLERQQGRDVRDISPETYKQSPEYRNRPQQFGDEGVRSITKNFAISKQLRDQIRQKIVTRPRDGSGSGTEEGDYATSTCYFYVVSGRPGYPQQPQPPRQPTVSREEYIQQQQRDFQRIPGFNVSRSGDRLIVAIPNTILFDFDSYELRYDARQDLDQVADILGRYPETNITVSGHTDSIGDANYNQRLSEYRAQSVAHYLISRGIQPYRISSVGYGEMYPVASNATEAGRQRNRRVELEITPNAQLGR
jgi:outer membrane protein OmpA-like peptidoglycan-associated protein